MTRGSLFAGTLRLVCESFRRRARLLGQTRNRQSVFGSEPGALRRWMAKMIRFTSLCAAGLALCLCVFPVVTPRVQAQQGGPPQGKQRQGGGMSLMGGRAAHGTVTAISGNNLTIKDEQGQTYTVETGPNTRIRKDRADAKLSDIHPGDMVVAVGNLDDKTKTVGAMFVVVLDPQQAARMEQMRAEFGKTWTAGKVTARQGLTLTVERPDKVTQTVTVNENTEFRKRGPDGEEDIALPDIKVGDRIMARGSLQNGSFVATTVGVMKPRPPGGPRSNGQQPGPGGPPPPQTQPNPQS